MLILNTTHRVAARAIGDAHKGTGTVEVEAARVGATKRTAPIVAIIEERTTAAVAGARQGQFKRRGKSPSAASLLFQLKRSALISVSVGKR